MILDGDFNRERLCAEYKKIIEPIDSQSPLAKMRQKWAKLSDGEFQACYKEVTAQITEGKLKSFSDLWDYAELMLDLSKIGLVQSSEDELLKELTHYIHSYGNNLIPDIYPDELPDLIYYDETVQSSLCDANKIISLIIDSSEGKRREKDKNEIKGYISDLSSKFEDFISHYIEIYTTADFQNSVESVFSYISVDELFSSVKELEIEKQKQLAEKFRSIYRQICSGEPDRIYKHVILKEYDNMKLYLHDAGESQYMSPEKYNKKLTAEIYDYTYRLATTNPEKW